jgi:hypothetical protein
LSFQHAAIGCHVKEQSMPHRKRMARLLGATWGSVTVLVLAAVSAAVLVLQV